MKINESCYPKSKSTILKFANHLQLLTLILSVYTVGFHSQICIGNVSLIYVMAVELSGSAPSTSTG